MKNLRLILTVIILLSGLCGELLASKVTIPPLVPNDILGTTGYYRWRHDNFLDRHPELEQTCSDCIPDYYLDYGERYVIKFTDDLYPKLSNRGKEWLVRARLNLQVAIEDHIRTDGLAFALLEENPSLFRKFAFDSHADAYLDAGLADLPLTDLMKIGTTPSIKDLLSKDGTMQVFQISNALGKDRVKKINYLFKNIHRQSKELVENNDIEGMNEAITLVEDMSILNRNVLFFYTRGFHKVRKSMKFHILNSTDEQLELEWRSLLTRLENLRKK